MQPVLTRLNPSPIEGLLVTFYAHRRRILGIAGLVLAVGVVGAFVVKPRYLVQAQVLVTLGSEYAYRPSAGETSAVNLSLEHDNAIKTESEILSSSDLHRDTIRAVGLGRLYPEYLEPPGAIARLVAAAKAEVGRIPVQLGLKNPAPPAPDPDPIELALDEFESELSTDVPKIGSTVTIVLKHKDAAVATEALNTMLSLYIERRRTLFQDRQIDTLAHQVESTRADLTASDARLEAFKLAHQLGGSDAQHQLGGFDAQRDILLHRKGEAEADHADAQNQLAQLASRLGVLGRQMQTIPTDVTVGHDTDREVRVSAVRQSLDALRGKYAETLSTLRADSPAAKVIDSQIRMRQADYDHVRNDASATTIRVAQNPNWLILQADRLKAEADGEALQTRIKQDNLNIATIAGQIRTLDEGERELTELQRARTVDEDAFRSAHKVLDDRRGTEAVEAHRRPSVGILQPAVEPVYPAPMRKLIVAVGLALSVFALVGTTLLLHAFSSRFWRAQAIEQDLGLAVMAEVMLAKADRLTDLLVLPRRLGRASDRLPASGA